MKPIILFTCLFVSLCSFAQDSFTEEDAKEVINTFFEGFHKGDTTMIQSVLYGNIPTQTVYATKKGVNQIQDDTIDGLVTQIGSRPADQVWEERLLSYEVQIDGNLAHVWTPYEFWVNGNFSHCGANAFTLAKTDTGWKIVHLIDSRRKSSCQQ